jgi:tocopherol O-methyltransferase
MDLKDKIIRHYDVVSPYYKELWGVHIHHGYWKTGDETKEQAQVQLIKELIARADIKNGARVLDVGCGVGGTSIYLHKTLGAKVTGITISPAQIEIGNKLARDSHAKIKLMLMDASRLGLADHVGRSFDVVWSVEAISHFNKKADFFHAASRLLKAGGKLVVADWFKSNILTAAQERKYIRPIEKAMLVPRLESLNSYVNYMNRAGLNVTMFEAASAKVARTWDISLGLLKNPALWKLAVGHGSDLVNFLKGFAAMKAGFKSKAFEYGIIIAQKD